MKNLKIHHTAIIDSGAQIGDGSSVWHWSHICSNAKIGKNVTIGQNVFIANGTIIGNDCKIQNNVSIFEGVKLGEGVFCGPSMVFTNVINPRSYVNRKNEYLETNVQRGVTFGANCTIVCGVEIGQFAFIAAGAVVTKNVAQFALMAGVPSRQVGWMSEYGQRINLPLEGHGNYTCPVSGELYKLVENNMVKV